MAKVPKIAVKSHRIRSRAARRAASPGAPGDISKPTTTDEYTYSTEEQRPDTPARPPTSDVLAARNTGSITKKQKQKPMSRSQRLRREKGVERAYAVADQLEIKVGKSKTRGNAVKERAADWVDVNTVQVPGGRKKGKEAREPKGKSATKAAPEVGDTAMKGVIASGLEAKTSEGQEVDLGNTATGPGDDVDIIV